MRSDGQLIGEYVHNQDSQALEELMIRHGRLVYGTCYSILRRTNETEDAVQLTFIALAQSAHRIADHQNLAAWLYRVAVRQANRLVRQRSAELYSLGEASLPEDTATTAFDEISFRETAAILHEEVQGLPEGLRTVILLCCFEGLSQEDAAAAISSTPGSVKSRLARARKRLRFALARRGIHLGVAFAMFAVSAKTVGSAALQAHAGLAELQSTDNPFSGAHSFKGVAMKSAGVALAACLIIGLINYSSVSASRGSATRMGEVIDVPTSPAQSIRFVTLRRDEPADNQPERMLTFEKLKAGQLPANWLAIRSKDWKIKDTRKLPRVMVMHFDRRGSDGRPARSACILNADHVQYTELDLQVDIQVTGRETAFGGAGLAWGFRDKDNYAAAEIDQRNGQVRVYVLSDGKPNFVFQEKCKTKPGAWDTLRIVQSKDRVEVFVSGKSIGVAKGIPARRGKVGLAGGTSAMMDKLRMKGPMPR